MLGIECMPSFVCKLVKEAFKTINATDYTVGNFAKVETGFLNTLDGSVNYDGAAVYA